MVVPFALGLALAERVSLPWGIWVAGGLAFFFVFSRLWFVGLSFVFVLLGVWYGKGALVPLRDDISRQIISGQRYVISGRVLTAPERAWGRTTFVLEAWALHRPDGDSPVSGRIRISLRGEKDLRPGDIVRLRGSLRHPRNFNNPGSFDYRHYLAARGIFTLGSVSSPLLLAVIGHEDDIGCLLENLRLQISQRIDRSGLFPEAVFLIKALVTGERRGLSPELRESFVRAGVAHLLAISGLHMGLLAMVVGGVVLIGARRWAWLMHRLDVKKLSLIAALMAVFLYTGVSGGSLPARRAAIMVSAFIIGFLLDRRIPSGSLILVAAWLILLDQPLAVKEPSFLLSFSAISGLAFMGRSLKGGRPFRSLLLVSLTAWLATGPFILYFFSRLSLISPLSNLVLVPLVGWLFVPLSLLAVVWPSILPGGDLLFSLLGHLTTLVLKMVSLWASVPPLILPLNGLGLVGGLLLAASLLALLRQKRSGLLLLPLALAFLFLSFLVEKTPSFQVVVFDVGQGASALLKTKDTAILIDGGGPAGPGFDVGSLVLAPALYRLGVRHLEAIILSHPEADHFSGLPYIIETFPVKRFIKTADSSETRLYLHLMETIKEKKVPLLVIRHPSQLKLNDLTVDFFPPGRGLSGSHNRRSLVTRVTYGQRVFLFPGDIDVVRERLFLEKDIRADFILVPHHGSSTSSSFDFLEKVCPCLAVISVSANNRFRLPAPEVLERYKTLGIRVFRTDLDGAVIICSDGYSLGAIGWLKGGKDGTFLRGLRAWSRCRSSGIWPQPGGGLRQCRQGHVFLNGGGL